MEKGEKGLKRRLSNFRRTCTNVKYKILVNRGNDSKLWHNNSKDLIRHSLMQCVDIKFLVWGNLKWDFFTIHSSISRKRKNVLGLKSQICGRRFSRRTPLWVMAEFWIIGAAQVSFIFHIQLSRFSASRLLCKWKQIWQWLLVILCWTNV